MFVSAPSKCFMLPTTFLAVYNFLHITHRITGQLPSSRLLWSRFKGSCPASDRRRSPFWRWAVDFRRILLVHTWMILADLGAVGMYLLIEFEVAVASQASLHLLGCPSVCRQHNSVGSSTQFVVCVGKVCGNRSCTTASEETFLF